MVCWGRLLPSRAFSRLLAGIDGWSRLCGVLGVLALLPHCLLLFALAWGPEGHVVYWGHLLPSHVFSLTRARIYLQLGSSGIW